MHFVNAKGILSASNGMNIYRGCTHGCIYCDSRSHCYQFTHAFEDIEVKQNAPMLLEKVLSSKRKKCMISTGAMSDPYMHCEEELRLTRRCLEIINKYGFGVCIQTKSNRVLRDLDLLKSINQKAKCIVAMTLTTFDESLCTILEPNVCTTKERFETLKTLNENGIETVAWIDPLLPFINDSEDNLRGILSYCTAAKVKGIICFNIGVTLRSGDREYFYAALDKHFPKMKEKYINKYKNSYEVVSDNNAALMRIFKEECAKHNIISDVAEVFSYMSSYSETAKFQQLSLF